MEQEETPTGDVEEQVTETPSEPVSKPPSEEIKATSEKDDQWRRDMQSRTDKAEAQNRRLEGQLQKLQGDMERQVKEARQRQIDAVSDDPEKQKELIAKFDFDDYKAKEMAGIDMAWNQVADLMTQYNLPTSSISELRRATNPEHMTEIAKSLAKDLELQQLKAKELEKPPVAEPSVETPAPDSGTNDAGTDSDEAFQKAWNEGGLPATKENMARAQRIISK